jgi:lysophospholipase L1-like esterase
VFEDTTIRQTVMVSVDADTIRLQLSNAFGGSDLPITAVTVALPEEQKAGISGIQADTAQTVTFSGSESFIVPNGAVVFSDPIEFPVEARSIVSVSIYLEKGQTTNSITSHPGSRTTSWFLRGNHVDEAELDGAASVAHWYFISAIEGSVAATNGTKNGRGTIAIVGDSITDGRGSTTDGNDRWPDQLLARLQNDTATSGIAILNQAAGGNRILADGLGPNGLGRIDRDVLSHSGVRWAIIFIGVNDIGTTPSIESAQTAVGDRIIQGYDQIITRLHRHGIAVIGCTITPMTGPGQSYGTPEREVTRNTVNEWIRTGGRFDAVVDFDETVRDPENLERLLPEYDTGDYLHLNPTGYGAMAEAVDLTLFS